VGNITQRIENGTTYNYTYDTIHKHAVKTVNGASYSYDANGNMLARSGGSITWTSANQAATVTGTGVSATFSYGPDRLRKQQVSTYNSAEGDNGTETTIYVDRLMEVETTPAQIHYKHFVYVPGGTRIVYDLQSVSGTQVTYITTDHLGSGNLFLGSAGTPLVNESFSAFGYRRSANWAGPLSASSSDYTVISSTTRRGYTDAFHEVIDNVGLIHMNGRVYDPGIGRFASPDWLYGAVGRSQSWNPYSYVSNRPLTLSDPNGLTEVNTTTHPAVDPDDLGEVTVTATRTTGEMSAAYVSTQNIPAQTIYDPGDLGEVVVHPPAKGKVMVFTFIWRLILCGPLNSAGQSDSRGTLQLGGAATGEVGGLAVTGGTGAAFDTHGNVALYLFSGGGKGSGNSGVIGPSAQASNAYDVNDLGGTFVNGSVSLGDGAAASLDMFSGPSDHGEVTGGGLTVGDGGGASWFMGPTYTTIVPLFNIADAINSALGCGAP
jgi:RHS repeat-associated protein